jgi:hypothetical protein
MICDIESPSVARRKVKAKQWVKDSALFWEPLVDEQDIGCDWCDATVRCWRCGHLRGCQKCHIVPHSLGGSDEPSNIIPLCADCHDEMPNVIDPSVVWEWIKNDHGDMHDTYWTFRAFAAAREQGMTDEELARFDASKLVGLEGSHSLHFGQLTGRARLTTTTLAWIIRQCCK